MALPIGSTGLGSLPGFEIPNADTRFYIVDNGIEYQMSYLDLETSISSGFDFFVANSTGTLPTAIGTNAIAIGQNAQALTTDSIAIGRDSEVVTGTLGIAMGFDAKSKNIGNVVIGEGAGDGTGSQGSGATLIGRGAGDSSSGVGQSATAIGFNSEAIGEEGVALGFNAESSAENAIAIGSNSEGDAIDSIAIGSRVDVTSSATYGIGMGRDSDVFQEGGVAIGYRNRSNASGAIVMGYDSTTTFQINSLANSFMLSWGNVVDFWTGPTKGTKITTNSDPANLTTGVTSAEAGSLVWDTTDNELQVYNGTSFQSTVLFDNQYLFIPDQTASNNVTTTNAENIVISYFISGSAITFNLNKLNWIPGREVRITNGNSATNDVTLNGSGTSLVGSAGSVSGGTITLTPQQQVVLVAVQQSSADSTTEVWFARTIIDVSDSTIT